MASIDLFKYLGPLHHLHPYLTCHNAQIKEISFLVRTLTVRTTRLRVLQLLLLKNNKINMDCNI